MGKYWLRRQLSQMRLSVCMCSCLLHPLIMWHQHAYQYTAVYFQNLYTWKAGAECFKCQQACLNYTSYLLQQMYKALSLHISLKFSLKIFYYLHPDDISGAMHTCWLWQLLHQNSLRWTENNAFAVKVHKLDIPMPVDVHYDMHGNLQKNHFSKSLIALETGLKKQVEANIMCCKNYKTCQLHVHSPNLCITSFNQTIKAFSDNNALGLQLHNRSSSKRNQALLSMT